jgi:hypothetical protein
VRSSNLLLNLRVTRSTAIISCAYPGDTLAHMVDHVNDPWFDRLLRHPTSPAAGRASCSRPAATT